MPDDLFRHIAACNNVALPGGYIPLRLGPDQVGWLRPETAEALARHGGERTADAVVMMPDTLAAAARALSREGRFRWRDEAFDVRAAPDGPVLTTLDRGALPCFGVRAVGVHLNGLVPNPMRLWVGHRAPHKQLDPNKLDHLAAGGVPAGYAPVDALAKEAEEEAGIPGTLIRTARHVATLRYAMARPEGLRRDLVQCYDLVLPPDFVPQPNDDEVDRFELWPIADVLDRVRRTNDFKFNVTLVLIDLFLRLNLVQGEEAQRLREGLAQPSEGLA